LTVSVSKTDRSAIAWSFRLKSEREQIAQENCDQSAKVADKLDGLLKRSNCNQPFHLIFSIQIEVLDEFRS